MGAEILYPNTFVLMLMDIHKNYIQLGVLGYMTCLFDVHAQINYFFGFNLIL